MDTDYAGNTQGRNELSVCALFQREEVRGEETLLFWVVEDQWFFLAHSQALRLQRNCESKKRELSRTIKRETV